MQGWILYSQKQEQLTDKDYGVNQFLKAASRLNIDLKVYHPAQFQFIISQTKPIIFLDGKPVDLPDFVMPRLGAQISYQALSLIRFLEMQGVYSINSSRAIEKAKDKCYTAQLLVANQLPTPKTLLLNLPCSLALVEREIGFPLVLKSVSGAKGVGVLLCETISQFQDVIGLLGEPRVKQLIAQEFIAESFGRDLRLFIIGERVIACVKRTAKHGFKANYSLGASVTSFPLSPEIEKLALDCARLIELEIGGIDLLFSEHGYLICEANSSPGFKGLESVTNLDVAMLILEYVRSGQSKKLFKQVRM